MFWCQEKRGKYCLRQEGVQWSYSDLHGCGWPSLATFPSLPLWAFVSGGRTWNCAVTSGVILRCGIMEYSEEREEGGHRCKAKGSVTSSWVTSCNCRTLRMGIQPFSFPLFSLCPRYSLPGSLVGEVRAGTLQVCAAGHHCTHPLVVTRGAKH